MNANPDERRAATQLYVGGATFWVLEEYEEVSALLRDIEFGKQGRPAFQEFMMQGERVIAPVTLYLPAILAAIPIPLEARRSISELREERENA